ncbi:MAG TPA: Npt1/Npt2 family nucleotide transporter [Alphaproteobacteria bacterium]|nr:Npt1/Npt2 family nucleotide transporter [Alphaproteobacteria bacterium]
MASLKPLKHKKLTPFQVFFWPVFPHETKLALYLASILFLIGGTNALIYPFHTSLLITSPHSGAEVIGFLRIIGTLPLSICFVIAYSWLHNKFNKTELISINYAFFIIFYLLYAFFIIPHMTSLNASPARIAQHMAQYPHIKWLFPLLGNWTASFFFVFTEVWLSVTVSQFFWQTANQLTKTDQATRLYPIFIIFLGLGGIVFSLILDGFIAYANTFNFHTTLEKLIFILQIVTIISIPLAFTITILFNYTEIHFSQIDKKVKEQANIQPPSVFEGFRYLIHSNYIFFIFLTLVSSEIIYQLINFLWKSELRTYATMALYYNDFLTNYALWNGIGIVIFAFATKNFIHKWGWFTVAFMPPIIGLITAIPFLFLLLFHSMHGKYTVLFNINPHHLLAVIGATQSIMMTAAFSCLYYPTKEMTYIPLDQSMKVKGKVAADVLGGSCGRAGSGIIQEGLLSWSGGMDLTIVPYLTWLILGLFGTWFYSTYSLGKKYLKLVEFSKKKVH